MMDFRSYLNCASLYVLPSHIEDYSKDLLEGGVTTAMACGLPLIRVDVPGMEELPCYCETGYLCGISPEQIRAATEGVLDDADLRALMKSNGQGFAMESFAAEQIEEMALALLG